LRGSKRPSDVLAWSDAAIAAFNNIKRALADATLLVHPTSDAPICLMANASNVAVGVMLQQYVHGNWCPIAFLSSH